MANEPGDDAVRDQYEAYPYPERDPADEAKRLIAGSPSHLSEVNHYVFAGRLDTARPLRALIAGGGTGDGTVMLAQQLAWAESPAEIVYLDVSTAARVVAEARAAARGLDNIRFVTGSLVDLATLAPGPYDYIDCCGVLHHLAAPQAGINTLAGALAADGGMGLMLYGALGRTGVYPMQEMLRMIAGGDDDRARIALARRLYDDLPESNWLRQNAYVGDHLAGGDAGLYDLLLHARDRAYTVPEIATLVAGAGLAVTGFIEPALYDPASYLTDDGLRDRVAALPWIERCAFAELLAGSLKRHVFYAVPAPRAGDAVARPDGPNAVPVLREADGRALARRLARGGRIKVALEGVELSHDMPPLAAAILALVDGRRSLGDIHAALARERRLDWLAFKGAFDRLYAALNAVNVMLVARPPRERT